MELLSEGLLEESLDLSLLLVGDSLAELELSFFEEPLEPEP